MIVKGDLTGFEEFERLLNELPLSVEKKVLQNAVNKSLREIRKDIAAAAPVDENGQSAASKEYGRLSKNIRVQKLKQVRRGEKGARIHTNNSFWGFLYEFGTKYQPARPWFLPKFTSLEERILSNLGKELGKGIEEQAGKK